MLTNAFRRFPAHLTPALGALEAYLRSGLPWEDDPYTEYTVELLSYDVCGYGDCPD